MTYVYTQNFPKEVEDIHSKNDQLYKAPPLHPALILQNANYLTQQEILDIIQILANVTKTKIRINAPKKILQKIISKQGGNLQIVNPFPLWARIINFVPILASASYSAVDFRKLGNFVVSIGNGPNLFLQPLVTTFHIAIIHETPKPKKIVNHTLVRPEILIIYKNPILYDQITQIRKQSLGKPTLTINSVNELEQIFTRALNIFNKMPFRWVDKLKDINNPQGS